MNSSIVIKALDNCINTLKEYQSTIDNSTLNALRKHMTDLNHKYDCINNDCITDILNKRDIKYSIIDNKIVTTFNIKNSLFNVNISFSIDDIWLSSTTVLVGWYFDDKFKNEILELLNEHMIRTRYTKAYYNKHDIIIERQDVLAMINDSETLESILLHDIQIPLYFYQKNLNKIIPYLKEE